MAHRTARMALLVSAAALYCGAGHAQSIDVGVDISASAEATKNPYLTDEGSSWVGAGALEVRPWLRSADETDSLVLRGLARIRGFTSRYDAETALGADLAANSRLGPRTSAYGSASILTTNQRTPFDVLSPTPGLNDPIVPPEVAGPVTDPIVPISGDDYTLLGSAGRITTISAGAGISHQPDPSSVLGYNINYNRLDSDDDGFEQTVGYDSIALGTNYSRQVTPKTSVGVSASGSRTRYEENRPSVTTLSVSGTLSQQLSRYWSLSASAGVSATDANANGFFPGYNAVAPIASVNLCNRSVRKSFCAGYVRSQQPTSLGDVRTSDAVTLSYSEQLVERQRVDLNASYSRSLSSDDEQSAFPDIEGLSLRAAFSQAISDRLEGYVSASVARSYGGYLSNDPNINFGVGVRLKLGARR